MELVPPFKPVGIDRFGRLLKEGSILDSKSKSNIIVVLFVNWKVKIYFICLCSGQNLYLALPAACVTVNAKMLLTKSLAVIVWCFIASINLNQALCKKLLVKRPLELVTQTLAGDQIIQDWL